VKEALNNIVKHAQAREVRLRLIQEHDKLTLVIEDDGRGFDAATTLVVGQGLENLANRLSSIGGRCAISSEPGRGTRVELNVGIA
jgi:signal transduction histidine kinase